MSAGLGTITLDIAMAMGVVAAVAGLTPRSLQVSLGAFWAFAALITFAVAQLAIRHDFMWMESYLGGSFLLWPWASSVLTALALVVNRRRHPDGLGYVIATSAAIALVFLALLLTSAPPPVAGKGLNPLLQDGLLRLQPLALQLGYVAMTVPFAFGVAALASRRLDASWLPSIRAGVVISWLFLSFGLVLSRIWAWKAWGSLSFSSWDPIETAARVVWCAVTASLVVVWIRKRLEVWSALVIAATFGVTIYFTLVNWWGLTHSLRGP